MLKPLLSALHHAFTTAAGRTAWRVMLALLVIIITALALVPAPPPTLSTGWDKANHALAFAALAFASVWAAWPQPRRWALLFVVVLAYGGAIEIAQSFLPPREADWADLAADAVGIALGLLAAAPLVWASPPRRR